MVPVNSRLTQSTWPSKATSL